MSSLFRDMFADTDTTLCQFGGSSSSTDRGAVARPTSDFESSLKLQHYPQVAEAIVSLTAIRERARVELARLGQMGATERCWISETERTKREACWSETYKACSKERELTNRTAIEATKDVQKHKASVAGEVAIQMQKSRSSLWDALTSWPATIGAHLVLATMLGQRLLSQSKMTLKVSARSLVLALLLLLIAVRSGLGLLMAKYSAVQGFKLGKFVIWRLLVPQSLQGQNRVRNDLPAPLADLAVKPPAAGDAAAAATEEATTAATATTAPAAAPPPPQASSAAAASPSAAAKDKEDSATTAPTTANAAGEAVEETARSEEETLEAVLAPWGLSMYAKPLHANGFDAEILHMLQAKEREDVMKLIECKPGHRVRFRLFFDGKPLPSSSSGGTASTTTSPSPSQRAAA
eukprot:CAMPEP_0206485802 /NCGR_PEP_ID=MMETSP0324_2-20121206/40707_1 /ASSEMBLY_ACC=CAM_ASM_000836 /TAXON_ID=2866 /ORGANISM="Crypthecodinium cohnii, Strain Seligo" /LENGTH=406 /DNA_ID=CAMNT_0053964051 /DNA_START=114 /DNA_END=1334 /DNA_ORIENTATION=-